MNEIRIPAFDNPNRIILDNSNFKLINGQYNTNSIDSSGSFDLDSYILSYNLSYVLKGILQIHHIW